MTHKEHLYYPESLKPSEIIMATTSNYKLSLLQKALEKMGRTSRATPMLTKTSIDEKMWERAFMEGPLGKNGHLSHFPVALAWLKAEHARQSLHPSTPILATDTAKIVGEKLLGKPSSPENAVKMILDQIGQEIIQIAGTAINTKEGEWVFGLTQMKIQAKDVSEERVKPYIKESHEAILDVAGAIPIFDPKAVNLFYKPPFQATATCYNINDMDNETEKTWLIDNSDMVELIMAIYGCSPSLLEMMFENLE